MWPEIPPPKSEGEKKKSDVVAATPHDRAAALENWTDPDPDRLVISPSSPTSSSTSFALALGSTSHCSHPCRMASSLSRALTRCRH
jgi:hypothetical protein